MPKKRADSADEADEAPMTEEQDDVSSTSPEKDEDSKGEPPLKRRKSEEGESEKKERSPELAKLWKAAEDDPSDFTAWTYLLQHVDGLSDADHGREAYDAFLFRYPYCYGYWKKYADFEKRLGQKEKCMAVFELGIKAIPLSADLWLHYLNHVKAEYAESPAFVRAQYERAVAACGREWRSDKLWDNFVKWEKEQKELTSVLKLYDRILANPTQGLSHQFEMFREFLKENSPKDILDEDDFLEMRKEVLEALEKEKGQADAVDADAENTALREKILFSRKKTYKATEEKVQARWKYEDNIKRPYFHMKPLERGQLKNWTEYLDFEIAEQAKEGGDSAVVETLFERCLIACALYEDFWLK
jgi:pre-mRNA-processing factor 39